MRLLGGWMAGWWPTRSMTGGNQAGSLAFTYTSATQTNQQNNQTTKSFTYGHFQQTSTTIKLTCATLTNFVKKQQKKQESNPTRRLALDVGPGLDQHYWRNHLKVFMV